MAHIKGIDRNQNFLLPPSLDEWIPKNHPARIIDMFVESVDLNALGIKEYNEFTGRPSFPKEAMTKLILYGYSRGERSSRVLERRTYEDLSYIWLTGNLHPDYRTIARFRQKNIKALKNLLAETLKLYDKVGIEFDGIIFSDGTKIRVNASDSKIATEERVKRLEKIAEEILKEAEREDKEEDKEMGEDNKHFFKAEKLEEIREEIKRCKEALSKGEEKVSLTDRDAKFMKHSNGGGFHLSYNAQLSVDRNGMILEADVVNKVSNDGELLKERVNGAEENLKKGVEKVVSDSGFYETKAIKELMGEGKEVIVKKPFDVRRERGKKKYYDIKDFKYDEGRDEYICPFGKVLRNSGVRNLRGKEYIVYKARFRDCKGCELREKCFKGKRGRNLWVLNDR